MNWAATTTLVLVILGAPPARAEEPTTSAKTQAKYDPPEGAPAKQPQAPNKSAQPPNKQGQPPTKQAQPSGKQAPPSSKQAPQPKPAVQAKRDGGQGAKHDQPASRPGGRMRCLSQGDTRETVAARKLFSPFTALRTAGSHARGETIGVRLCRHNEDLFYEVNVLRRDGRVVKVILDAASGKVLRSVNDR